MKNNNLPKKISIFPLSNAIFFPNTVLPLNIFEDRYLQLVNDCMKEERVFGMVQPKTKIGSHALLKKSAIFARDHGAFSYSCENKPVIVSP